MATLKAVDVEGSISAIVMCPADQLIEIADGDIREAIKDSIRCGQIIKLTFVLTDRSTSVQVQRSTHQVSEIDLRSGNGSESNFRCSNLTIPEDTIARNLKRAKGALRKMAIQARLDKHTTASLTVSFKLGQVCEVERRYNATFAVAADFD